MKMKEVEALIIGAGISGLTYAAHCKDDYLIVEKECEVGGLCRTIRKDGFVWDYAGHFFHFANSDLKAKFEKDIRPSDMVNCIKKTNINYNGMLINYPFQMNIHQLPKEEFIDCLYDLFQRNTKEVYENFQDMLVGKFGISITEKFLKPYNEKLYACSLNCLDQEAMGRFFPYADPEQIILNMKRGDTQTYNSTFDYPRQGAQFYINILLNQIDKDKLMLNSKLEMVDSANRIAVVNGEEIHYDRLINTIPLNHFMEFLFGKEKEIVDSVLNCNKVLVFNLGFDKKAIDESVHWTYFPMKEINFYRVGYYSNILKSDRLSMYVEIGFEENGDINVDEQLRQTLNNLKKFGIISEHKLVAYNTLIISPGYVHITKQSIEKVALLKNILKKKSIYTIGRYGGWTYCSIEDCMIEAIELAENQKKE